jgi:hypothetical protein
MPHGVVLVPYGALEPIPMFFTLAEEPGYTVFGVGRQAAELHR